MTDLAATLDSQDKELLTAIRAGDRQAFTSLYTRFTDPLYNYVFAFTRSEDLSKELVQDVFIHIWMRKDLLENVSDLDSYIFRATRNRLLNQLKSRRSYDNLLKNVARERSVHTSLPEDRLEYQRLESIAREAIRQLPPKRKLIFQLSTQENLRLDEIASLLRISKPVVKKQLYAAIKSVRTYLKERGGIVANLLGILFLKIF